MSAYQRYGIALRQIYARADGGPGRLIVRDVETFAVMDQVVVFDEATGAEYRLDATQLAQGRYRLLLPPYAVRALAAEASTGLTDYLMTDGSVQALAPADVCWAAPQPRNAGEPSGTPALGLAGTPGAAEPSKPVSREALVARVLELEQQLRVSMGTASVLYHALEDATVAAAKSEQCAPAFQAELDAGAALLGIKRG